MLFKINLALHPMCMQPTAKLNPGRRVAIDGIGGKVGGVQLTLNAIFTHPCGKITAQEIHFFARFIGEKSINPDYSNQADSDSVAQEVFV